MGMMKIPFLVLMGGLGVGMYVHNQRDHSPTADIEVISTLPIVEEHLTPYKELIGSDYDGYRGHIYRVLSYTNHFMKGTDADRDLVATALVYHDIGLWTKSVLNYLEPSFEEGKKKVEASYTPEQMQLFEDIIMYHHKVTPFDGPNAKVVNAAMNGDWVDATQGFVHSGLSKANIAKVEGAIANAGFHDTLAGFGPKLYGNNWWRIVTELGQIMRW